MLSFCQNEFIFIDSAHVFSFSSFSKVNLEQEHSLSLSLSVSLRSWIKVKEKQTNKQNTKWKNIWLNPISSILLFYSRKYIYRFFCLSSKKLTIADSVAGSKKLNQTKPTDQTHTRKDTAFSFYGNILFRVPNKQNKNRKKT